MNFAKSIKSIVCTPHLSAGGWGDGGGGGGGG